MAKLRVASAQRPKTVQEWMDRELKRDAELRREVDETLNRMRIEQDLAKLRERRHLSQRQLAHMLGVKQPVIAKIEAGQGKNLELRTLIKITAALGAKVKVTIVDHYTPPRRIARRVVKRVAALHRPPLNVAAGGS